jgi:dihydrofolate reductase
VQNLLVFNSMSLDGYFTDARGEMGFAYDVPPDPEFDAWTSGNASGGGGLIFGRKTYELMIKWWPTPAAALAMPAVAAGMNKSPKYVFSRTLKQVTWQNTQLLRGDPVSEVRRLKSESGAGLVILGSGSLVPPLLAAGLVDKIQVVLIPSVLGAGRTMFEGLRSPSKLKLAEMRSFKNGKVVLSYEPVRQARRRTK